MWSSISAYFEKPFGEIEASCFYWCYLLFLLKAKVCVCLYSCSKFLIFLAHKKRVLCTGFALEMLLRSDLVHLSPSQWDYLLKLKFQLILNVLAKIIPN